MLNLSDDPPWPVPGSGPILKAPVAHQRGVARPAARPGQKILDGPLQDIVGREADSIRHAPSLQRFVEGGERIGRVGADKVAVVGRLLLRAVDGTLGAVDIEGYAPNGLVWHQVRIEAGEP
jgi:hypothetical protein